MKYTFALLCNLAAAALALPAGAAPAYDLIIRNGRVIDGSGSPWFRGDIALTSTTIAAVGVLDPEATAPVVIDAADRYVAPGFIDVHTHCEDDLLTMPLAENFVRMGVTTLVTGNCGSSYTNFRDAYTTHVQQGFGPNFSSLIGHNSVRRRVMGNAGRDPSTTEIQAMRRIVRRAMDNGALGLSTGLIYTPGTYSKTEEIIELAKEASAGNGIYVSHMRSEGAKITDAIEEALRIGREANLPVHISHFKITSPRRFGQSTQTIQMVEDARAAGQDVTVDQYAYTASSTSISTMLPDWAVEGTTTEVRNRLSDPTTRSIVARSIIDERRDSGRPDLSYARVASFRADPSINGMNLLEVAKKWKNDSSWEAQADVVMDIVTSGGAGMVFHSMDEQDVQNIMKYPNSMVASDSGVRRFGQGVPHPRGYGNNARVLSRYVRGMNLLRLEEAIRKMTSLPARTMRFMDRGLIRAGMAADLVIFDLNRVDELSTFEKPHAYAEGFDYVLVNGDPVIQDGQLTERRPGQILRGKGFKSRPEDIPLEEPEQTPE